MHQIEPSQSMVDALLHFYGEGDSGWMLFSWYILRIRSMCSDWKKPTSLSRSSIKEDEYFDRDWWHESSLPSTDHDQGDFIWIIPISQTNGRNLSGKAIFLPVYSQKIPIGSM